MLRHTDAVDADCGCRDLEIILVSSCYLHASGGFLLHACTIFYLYAHTSVCFYDFLWPVLIAIGRRRFRRRHPKALVGRDQQRCCQPAKSDGRLASLGQVHHGATHGATHGAASKAVTSCGNKKCVCHERYPLAGLPFDVLACELSSLGGPPLNS